MYECQSTPSDLTKGLQVEGYGLTAMSSRYISSPLQAGLRGGNSENDIKEGASGGILAPDLYLTEEFVT